MFLLYLILCLIPVNGDQKTFPSSFNKKDFRVTTLKDPDFAIDEEIHPEKGKKADDCPDFSPEELKKIKIKYASEGGRIKFVSADPLTTDKEEIKKAECLKKILATTESGEKNMKASFDSPVKFENRTVFKKDNNTTDTGKRRGNEYEFDTVEYYDDSGEIKFANEACLGLVDIIDLDLADIRKYDLECEKLCEWVSLYDIGTWD